MYLRGDNMKDLLNRKELAEYLGVNVTTVHVWRTKGMPHIRLVTGRILYDPVEVEKWLLGK